jgi:hypothetical protein
VASTARSAHAQASGETKAAVRATSTVEVIDSARAVDDIISRVRAQQRTQLPTPPVTAERRTPRAGDERRATRDHVSDEIRAERPERAHVRSERADHADHADKDQRERRSERNDLRRERPADRARAPRR